MDQVWTEDGGDPSSSEDTRVDLKLSEDTPLREARAKMEEFLSAPNGVYCPCCRRVNKIYRRGMTWEAGAWLCLLVKRYLSDDRWHRVSDFYNLRGGDYAKLRFWDLAVMKEGSSYDKKVAGLWKPTEKGIRFARGDIKLPYKALVYLDECVGFDESKMVDIHEITNKSNGKFVWEEQMKGIG